MDKTIDSASLAKMLCITDRQVRNHAQDGLFKRIDGGRYNAEKCVPAYIRYLKKHLKGNTESLTSQRTRLVQIQASRAQLDYETAKRENLPLDLCVNFWKSILNSVRSKLLSIASSLKTKYPQLENDIIISIDDLIKESLQEASQSGIPTVLSKHLDGYSISSAAAPEDDRE